MGRMLAVLAPIWVFACAAPDNSPQGVCARQAENDPTVLELRRQSAINVNLLAENQPRLKEARRQATNRCLTTMGLAPRGGVEAPNPP